jgi:hypothetical protein
MAEPERRPSNTPEDEGIPDFDEDLRKRKLIEQDEDMPLPSDRPLAAFDRVTPTEQRRGESVNTRVAREVPDQLPESHEHPGRIIEPAGDGDGADIYRELIADETDDGAALSPEEAAMHIVEEDEG